MDGEIDRAESASVTAVSVKANTINDGPPRTLEQKLKPAMRGGEPTVHNFGHGYANTKTANRA